MPDHDLLRRIAEAAEDRDDAQERWAILIRHAVASGERVADVATAAGVTPARVYQIRDGRR